MDDSIMALAQLICNMNPYTGVTDSATGIRTDEMVVGQAQQDDHMFELTDSAKQQILTSIAKRIPSITVEVERNYATTWTFRGQTHTIRNALRVPYTFDRKKGNDTICRETDYLLIGFAGSGGDG